MAGVSEEWRDIPGYENNYIISNFGDIKIKKSFHYTKNGRIMKPCLNRRGYLYVILTNRGIQRTYTIHRLVLRAFKGDSSLWCNHKDGNKKNNNLSNLEYCSPSENIRHAFENGLSTQKGEHNSCAKLNNKDVIKIRELYLKEKISLKEIANRFNITKAHACAIGKKRIWKHI